MKKVLALVLAAMLLVSCMSIAVADEEIVINVWSFTDEVEGLLNNYYLPAHPDVKVDYQMTPTADFPAKLDNIMSTAGDGDNAPDVFALEAAFVKKYVNSDVTASLLDLGFTAEELEGALPVMLQIGTAPDGTPKALSWQSTPGALMYRASLAEKYLGVTTPEAFQETVADWDTFLETAATINEVSEGACKMVVGSGDIWNVYQYQRSEGWVVDGKLVIDDELYDYLELTKTLEQDNLSLKSDAWTETWYTGMRGDTEVMCYFLPTWGLHYTIKPNCVAGGGDAKNDDELAAMSAEKGGTFGDWRMVAGPCGYSWGGTWMGANAKKVAVWSDAKKAAVKDLIYFLTLDVDQLYTYAKNSGDFVGCTAAVEKIIAEGGTPNPFLGGQDHYGMFYEAASLANGSLMTEYDADLNDLWGKFVTAPYSKGEKELDECIADFKAEVAAAFANIVVE